jgi:hypothetical protein
MDGAILTKLQADIAGRLKHDPALADFSIISDDKGDIENRVTKALKTISASPTGKIGACVLVLRPVVKAPNPNLPGPATSVACSIQVIEHVTCNRSSTGTQILSDDLGFRVLKSLHHFTIGHHTLAADPSSALKPTAAPEGIVSYEVNLNMQLGVSVSAKATRPTITEDSGTVTISAVGGTLYYSTDGSNPDTAYTTPFPTPATGTRIRAVATGADSTPSDIEELTIN